MKIRNGFVSNSSSSSFTCDVCGEEASGMDICLDDAEMYQCINGHTFCDSEKLDGKVKTVNEKREQLIKEFDGFDKERLEQIKKMDDEEIEEEYEDYYGSDEERYDCDPSCCPICQFKVATDTDIAAYFLLKTKNTREQVLELFKKEFKDYKTLKSVLYDKKSTN